VNKIALGTAQFGMDYGINNRRGKIPQNELFEILNLAFQSGIDTLDTAHSYGDSETLIGAFSENFKKKIKVVSKLPACNPQEVNNIFLSSLEKLKVKSIYGYLIHNFKAYSENPKIWNILETFKSHKQIKKIGFSIYYPYELESLLENKVNMDIIQVPYSIFDQRFVPYFPELKKNGIEVHIRSVFLQGLVFKDPDELDNHFVRVKDKVRKLHLLSSELGISVASLCVDFTILNKFVDKVIVGIDGMDHFREIISSLSYLADVERVINTLSIFKEDDENIILPINWTSVTA